MSREEFDLKCAALDKVPVWIDIPLPVLCVAANIVAWGLVALELCGVSV
jgi:hypothetical protein